MEPRTYKHFFYSPSNTAKENLFYIESVGHYWCDKSFFENSYYTQNYYLIYSVSGRGYYVHNTNEKIVIKPGQLLFINLSLPYKYYSCKKKPWEFLWMYFGGKDADWYYQTITNKNKAIFNLNKDSKIPDLINTIFNLYEKKDPYVEIKTSSIITNILAELYIESMKGSSVQAKDESDYPDPVKTIIDFIQTNYFRRITLEELSSIIFLDKYYLLRLFKKHTGYTPIEYINKYRLDFSKKLLLEQELSIEQIALNVGFYSQSYFSKQFKASIGLTPKQFRDMYMKR